MDKVSYAFGMLSAKSVADTGITSISLQDFNKGFEDFIKGEPDITLDEAGSIINEHLRNLHENMATANIEMGSKFLEENAKSDGVEVLPSGLQYKVLVEGTGKTPGENDTVECHYEGRLINGRVFDSSYQRGETAKFNLSQVIPGWTEGLQLMKEGGKTELYIPYQLAYGERGVPGIPPFSTLIFTVELVKIL